MRYKDPYENDPEDEIEKKIDDDPPEINREFVRARLHSRTIVVSLPSSIRQPVGVLAGSKVMLTVIDNETDLKQILRDGKSGILLTKE